MRIGDEVHRLGQDVTALQYVDVAKCTDSYSQLSYEAAIRGEEIVQKLRRLVFDTANISKVEYLSQAADALGITIREDADIVEITLPCLLPGRKSKSNDFISGPLFGALSQFIANRREPFKRFEHCAICITHVYNKTLMAKRRIRDHDNMEVKGIIDVINLFLLSDDTGGLCDIFNTSEIADTDMTRIAIMKKDAFPEWVLR